MTRRVLLVAAVVVVAALAFGGFFLARSSSGADSYDAEGVQDNFMAACVADGGEPVRPTCACVWDELVASISFERFAEVDEVLAPQAAAVADGTPLELPDDIGAIVRGCAEMA